MVDRLIAASIARPWRVFSLVLLLAVVALAMFPSVIIDTDPENMLPANQPERVFHQQTKARFALHDAIVVGLVSDSSRGVFNPGSLADLHALSEAIGAIDGVIEVDLMSLASVDNIRQDGPGSIRFEWMMAQPPADQQAADRIAAAVARLPLFEDTLASADDAAAAIYVPIASKNESHRIAGEIQSLIDALESGDRFYITGLPVAEDTFGYEMFVQMAICAPLAGLVIYLLMWLFFRNALFVTAPMLVAMGSVIITMGALIGMGFSVHIMSSMIAIFLMPIAVVDSVHILSDFAQRYRPGTDPKTLIASVLRELFRPMLFTSLTSAVGFASLLLTPIPPVQIFGGFVAFGILLAFVLTLTLLPAFVSVLSPSALATLTRQKRSAGVLARMLPSVGRWSQRHRGAIVLVSLVIGAVSVVGLSRIEVNDNPVRWFKASHPIRVADRALNEHFAGTYDAFLVLERDSKQLADQLQTRWLEAPASPLRERLLAGLDAPVDLAASLRQSLDLLDSDEAQSLAASGDELDQWIDRVEQAQSELAYFQQPAALNAMVSLQQSLQGSGLIGKSNSLADAVKTVYRELRGGEPEQAVIPPTQAGVAQTLLQYQSSHRPQDLWHFTTTDYRSTVIWLQMRSGDNQDMSKVEAFVAEYFDAHPLPADVSARWAGKTHLNGVWQREMVSGMALSLAGAFVAVFLMMVLLFRSLLLGALAMLPLTLTITVIYGAIGWFGKDYDMPIAVLSALALGLSVDFAIHFIERARALYAISRNLKQALDQLFEEPALAISRNAVVIAVGFSPLLLAPLVPYITVGYLLAAIMALSAAVSLLLLAALLGMGDGWVLKRTMR